MRRATGAADWPAWPGEPMWRAAWRHILGCCAASSVDWRLGGHGLEPFAARGQKARGLQPVEHPVVERETEVHHRLDPDHAADRHRPVDDGLHGEYARLSRFYTRVAEQRAARSRGVHGKRAPGTLVTLQPP